MKMPATAKSTNRPRMFDVRCLMFDLRPPVSSTLSEAMGNFPAGVTAQAAAIDNDFFAGRPNRQKLRQQFIPPVFVQRNRARNVIAREFIVRPCINPDRSVAPFTRLLDGDHFRRRNCGAPRNLVAKINRLACRGENRQGCQNNSLPDQRRFHLLIESEVRW